MFNIYIYIVLRLQQNWTFATRNLPPVRMVWELYIYTGVDVYKCNLVLSLWLSIWIIWLNEYKTPNVIQYVPIYVKKNTVIFDFFFKKILNFSVKIPKRSVFWSLAEAWQDSSLNIFMYSIVWRLYQYNELRLSIFIFNTLNYFWFNWTITRKLCYVWIISGPSAAAMTD